MIVSFCLNVPQTCHMCGDASRFRIDLPCLHCGTHAPHLCHDCREAFVAGRSLPAPGDALFSPAYQAQHPDQIVPPPLLGGETV